MTPTHKKLTTLSQNLWWSWHPEALALFEALNPQAFAASNNNPIAALNQASPAILNGPAFAEAVDAIYAEFDAYMARKGTYADADPVAYFCMEYGLHESLPLYSGGLGILAGDHTKAASDLGLPLTAVGLLLRDGYFQQYFDENGRQLAHYPPIDLAASPCTLVTDAEGQPVLVDVKLGEATVSLQAWLLRVGHTRLYLLDSDLEANDPAHRYLTRKLYQGGNKERIQQEIILGIGGLRMLRALDVPAATYHMNEGHCAFLTFELLRERLEAGDALPEAEKWVREHAVFTTHTPVKAGHDRFSPNLFHTMLGPYAQTLGLETNTLMAYGRTHAEAHDESFTMTILGLRLARIANGVSKLNGEVARWQWKELYPNPDVAPISHITNGVHLPTWAAPQARAFLYAHLGDWLNHCADPDFWAAMENVSDEALWEYRTLLRRRLIDYVQVRAHRGSMDMGVDLDPEALTIGFARRFATYKRAPLLFNDLESALDLFANTERPIQLIYAGKAHPHDEKGKDFIQHILHLTRHPQLNGKLIFLENYSMETGRYLVSGCDVWLNNPRRPMEASGTSGQKVALHGGLNLSILDGWWPEGYNGQNGWAIGDEASAEIKDTRVQDQEDVGFLHHTLRNDLIPTFYDRDERGLPLQWIAKMRNAMVSLPPAFSSARMVRDYIETIYQLAGVES